VPSTFATYQLSTEKRQAVGSNMKEKERNQKEVKLFLPNSRPLPPSICSHTIMDRPGTLKEAIQKDERTGMTTARQLAAGTFGPEHNKQRVSCGHTRKK